MSFEPILRPLKFRNLEVKNRIFRSNISGRFYDNYDGSGGHTRINWETKFARGGVGAIISSFVPVSIRGRIVPGYATIDADDKIPFWRAVGDAVHDHGCKFILQLSHSGRQQDISGVENLNLPGLSSTSKTEEFHGLVCKAMTPEEIRQTVDDFAEGAYRAREAGLDGVELHGANGYLITQFLSPAINDRKDRYGGDLERRANFVREIVRAIRARVGADFHLQMKISAQDYNNAVFFWKSFGTRLDDSVKVCRWLVEDGVDAIHVSSGNMFPHPRNPMGGFPLDDAVNWYDTMLSSGVHTHRNYRIFRSAILSRLFQYFWHRSQEPPDRIEGALLTDARTIREALGSAVPIICTGGFQTGRVIADAIERGDCDAVSIARPLIANNDMVRHFERGEEIPAEKRCTYCNKCLLNTLENPLGCYEVSRFGGDESAMLADVMSVFHPRAFGEAPASMPAPSGSHEAEA